MASTDDGQVYVAQGFQGRVQVFRCRQSQESGADQSASNNALVGIESPSRGERRTRTRAAIAVRRLPPPMGAHSSTLTSPGASTAGGSSTTTSPEAEPVKTFLKITLFLALGLGASTALAFHDGGVAECAGCHTMHNSQDGALVRPTTPPATPTC